MIALSSLEIAQRLKGLNVYLVGMMGVGKTTVGQALAQVLGYQFFDTDILIEQLAQESIPEIFKIAGEGKFRDWETQVLAQLSGYQRLIVATGGGIVVRRENWGHLRHGLIIWLDVPIDELYRRLAQDQSRPLLQTENPKKTLEQLLQQRRSLYGEADLHILPSKGELPDQTVERILGAIPAVLEVETEA
jgi:shikimate kinase